MAAPIVVAVESFSTDIGGTPVFVSKGQRERDDSAVVKASPSMDGSGDEAEINALATQRRMTLWLG